ncbi:hypothetical protein C3486_03785 [Streptomyces sp. Ru73]|uniref:hypothetical protein n=1 Tax=Streptomyces sp. Ru73 TaxID=2080748 RepID=UPI000CDE3AD1|nr:hypothetical protein [Streptomyces sp. Ru73]POX42702.1 hypothetical protein C3486_03785 [Streptomyces sp. Ru73]
MAHTTPFPRDLLDAQRDWNRTYAALAARPANTAALRRRLQLLSARIAGHPFWTATERRSAATRAELRRQARALEERDG